MQAGLLKKLATEIKDTAKHPRSILKGALFRNTAILLSGDASARLISLASLTITVRSLGPEYFGMLALAETYAKLVDRIVNFQSWSGVIKYGSEALQDERREDMPSLVMAGYKLDILSAIVGFFFAYSLVPQVAKYFGWKQEMVLAAKTYTFLILMNITGTPIGILRLTENFNLLAKQRIIYSFLRFGAVTYAAITKGTLIHFILAWLLSEITGYVILNSYAFKIIKRNNWLPSKGRIKGAPKGFLPFVLWTNLASTVNVPIRFLDIFLVSSIVSVQAAGIYKVFQQISHVLKKPAEPLGQVVFPYFSKLIAEKSYKNLILSGGKILLLVSFGAFFGATLLGLSAGWWLPGIFGEDFRPFVFYFFLYIVVQALAVAIIPVDALFIALGLVQKNFIIQLLANISFLVSAYVLGRHFGLQGIILALAIHPIIIATMKTTLAVKEINENAFRNRGKHL